MTSNYFEGDYTFWFTMLLQSCSGQRVAGITFELQMNGMEVKALTWTPVFQATFY